MRNLDRLAAKTAQDIIKETSNLGKSQVDNLVTKTLGVLQEQGVEIITACKVQGFKKADKGYVVASNRGTYQTRFLIAAAGLYSDRIAKKAGLDPGMKIVPFRGEYWHLKQEKRHLVNHLIYPVPNPKFPFLGVHMTRLIDGSVHAGPNAVLAFSREGYRWRTINPADLFETLTYGGFWKLAGGYLSEGFKEMYRSVVKSAFLKSVQELIPDVESSDLLRGEAGVRAQALWDDDPLTPTEILSDSNVTIPNVGFFLVNIPVVIDPRQGALYLRP